MLKLHKIKLHHLLLWSFGCLVFAVLKLRILSRLTLSPTIIELYAYCSQDIIVYTLFFLLFSFIPRSKTITLFAVYLLSLLNLFCLSKLGFPLTRSILSQIDDIMMIQSSIQSPGIYRNIILIMTLILSFLILWFVSKRIKKEFTMMVPLLILIISIPFLFIQINPKFGVNAITSLIRPTKNLKKLADNFPVQSHFNQNTFQSYNYNLTKKVNENIVLIIVETLSSFGIKNKLPEVMPNLAEMKRHALSFHRHYSSWPFSSKSLYSLLCGRINYPTEVIEMRMGQKFSCDSWVKPITQQGHQSHVYYTGDFLYDNMGKFFRNIGFKNLYDRHNLSKIKEYQSTDLSVDDQSMVDQFDKDLSTSKAPFISTFITMNSHFPFWDPVKTKKFNSPYLKSLHYQDRIIGNIILTLKKHKVYDDSIIVITGDHGKRESTTNQQILPESMFKVPLIIKIPGKKTEDIHHPTNHYQLGKLIIDSLNERDLKDSPIMTEKKSFLFFETDKFYFSLIRENHSTVFDQTQSLFKEDQWPNFGSPRCSVKDCPEDFAEYKGLFQHLLEVYNEK